MSMSPPPGWYSDPTTPFTERWWDGTGWTEHRRAASAAQPPQQSTVPLQPVTAPVGFGPAVPTPGGGLGRGKGIALVAAGLVVVAAVVTGTILLGGPGDDQAGPTTTSQSPLAPDTGPGPTDSPTPSPSPSRSGGDPSVVVDDLNRITLPVVDGWGKAEFVVDETILLTTPGTYDCPGDGSLCHHGTVASSTVTGSSSTDPKVVAKSDIAEAASHAFDHDEIDQEPFKGIVSHEQIKAGAVAVAGQSGYLVRWHVKTKLGPGGYVESLVFPSSTGSRTLVCVRFAFDAGRDGPPLSDMDKITDGIRSVDDTATGGGVGSSVGPAR